MSNHVKLFMTIYRLRRIRFPCVESVVLMIKRSIKGIICRSLIELTECDLLLLVVLNFVNNVEETLIIMLLSQLTCSKQRLSQASCTVSIRSQGIVSLALRDRTSIIPQ